MSQLAVAKKARTKRLTKRQQADVEKLYPMAKAIGRRWQHRDADAMDRAHDFIVGVMTKMRSKKSRAATPKGFARIDGIRGMLRENRRYKLVYMPERAYKEADETTRARNRSHASLDLASLPAEDQDDDAYSEVRAALRRLDPRVAEILERVCIREEPVSDVAEDLGVSQTRARNLARQGMCSLRNDVELCRALGRTSFHDRVPTPPESEPPSRDGMRAAAAYLRRQGGPKNVAALRVLADAPLTLHQMHDVVPEAYGTLGRRVASLINVGLVRRRPLNGREACTLTTKGRRLLNGVRRLEEWDASREAAKVPV